MRVVAPRLAVKIPLAVATRAGRITRAVLWPKAFQARPGFQQRAVDREMLTRQQRLDLVLRQHCGEKLSCDIAFQQAVAALGERRCIPHQVLDYQADKPDEPS